MGTKPTIRISPGDVPAPRAKIVDVTLFGGHMDGMPVREVELAGTWPVITTMETVRESREDSGTVRFIKRRYQVCLHFGGAPKLDRSRRVRYCLVED